MWYNTFCFISDVIMDEKTIQEEYEVLDDRSETLKGQFKIDLSHIKKDVENLELELRYTQKLFAKIESEVKYFHILALILIFVLFAFKVLS